MPEYRENIQESRILDLVTEIATTAMVARRHADGQEMNRFSDRLHGVLMGNAWNRQKFEMLQVQLSGLVTRFGMAGNPGGMYDRQAYEDFMVLQEE